MAKNRMFNGHKDLVSYNAAKMFVKKGINLRDGWNFFYFFCKEHYLPVGLSRVK